MKELKVPLTLLCENCKKAVNKEIKKECREEAVAILELCDEKDSQEFLRYSKKLDRSNLCCLVLDFVAKKLVDEGTREQKEGDYFKDPYIWLDDESNNKEE